MTETTAQPLTREDIMAAVIDALNNNTVKVMTSGRPSRFRLVAKSEQAARDRHPAGKAKPLAHTGVRAIVSEELGIARELPADHDLRIAAGRALECYRRAVRYENSNRSRWGSESDKRPSAAALQDLGNVLLEFLDGVDASAQGVGFAAVVDLGHSSSPSVDGCGDLTVGEAGSVGGASVSSTEKVDDPRISARYDRALNMIAISVDGEDDVYLPRDGAFNFSDEIAQALEVQAKLGGAA